MNNERRIANTKGIYSLWLNWAIAVGSLVLVPLLSLYISKIWVPIVVLLIEISLYFIVRNNVVAKKPSCMKLPHIAMVSLFVSAIIILLVNLFYAQPFFDVDLLSKSVNRDIPYIVVLILAPVTFIVSLLNILKGLESEICVECLARNGSIAERGFLGRLFSQEGEYLSKMLLMLSLFTSLISWAYYIIFYIDANINSLDKFVFVWMPILIYVISLIYLGFRYFSLWLYYSQNIEGASLRFNSSSLVRYIIICDDSIYLKVPDESKDSITLQDYRIDTPARLYIQYKEDVSSAAAIQYFENLSGIKNAKLRLLYINTNFKTECNIFHYAYFLNDKSIIQNSRLEGQWYTLAQISALIDDNKISSIFSSEIKRIYKMTMAWKMYDVNGKRLYNIKNYRPTFRIDDIKNCEVDFNDIRWLFVSGNNEDRRCFNLRKIWYKYICGIGILR